MQGVLLKNKQSTLSKTKAQKRTEDPRHMNPNATAALQLLVQTVSLTYRIIEL